MQMESQFDSDTADNPNVMDHETYTKWLKVRKALEEAGKTNCYIYQKALAITNKTNAKYKG